MAGKTTKKATRKLTDIDFSQEGAAISLVGPVVGGAANGHSTLIMKGVNFSEEFVKKAQKVQVTMELPEFLQKFFGLWYEESYVLATMMGYDRAAAEAEHEAEEAKNPETDWLDEYVKEKVQSFTVMKAAKEGNLALTLADLTEDQYLQLLKDQEYLEPIMKQFEAVKASKSNKETLMDEEIVTEVSVESISKAQYESILKQLDDAKTELKKSNESLAVLLAEKQEAAKKAKFEIVKSAVADEAAAAVIFKALGLVEDETVFTEVVDVLKNLATRVDNTDLFVETGASAQEEIEPVAESAVAKILKSRVQAGQVGK